jgi:hypothetical protein
MFNNQEKYPFCEVCETKLLFCRWRGLSIIGVCPTCVRYYDLDEPVRQIATTEVI